MALKRKSATRPLSWRRVRPFEYNVPTTLDATVAALMTTRPDIIDIWLQRIAIMPEQNDTDTVHFTGACSKQHYFDGYLKALPDNTTLVSGKISAFMTEPPPLAPEENAEFSGYMVAFGVFILLFIFCALTQLGLGAALTQLGTLFIGIVNLLVFLVAVSMGYQWWLALQRRDDMLLALQNRLGFVEDIQK